MNNTPPNENEIIPGPVPARRRRRRLMLVLLLILAAGGAWWGWVHWHATAAADAAKSGSRRGGRAPGQAIPVQVGNVRLGELRIYFGSLGTVTPTSTVIVHTRIDGQLNKLDFKEGQMVRAGQLLAEIDPRPLQVALSQAEGQMAKDMAQLQNARRDLARYQGLLAQDSISRQQVDTTDALVRQYEGVIKTDQAQVDSAKLQLSYTRIVAPVSGRLGLRQVDAGNMIHSSDAAGIVTINQVQPISVVFTLPESQLPSVLRPLQDGQTLRAEAWDRGQKQMLSAGRVASLDNQIDLTTGTVKLKASFPNEDGTLFPNQFVNVRLLAETRQDAVIAPSAAIQRGRAGSFVYVVKEDKTVTQRTVETGATEGLGIEITKGLQAGDVVVTDGIDQLREGAKVEVADAGNLLKEKPRGAGKGRNGRGRRGGADASGPLAETQSGPQSGPQGDRPRRRPAADGGLGDQSSIPDNGRVAAPAGQSMPEGGRRFRPDGPRSAQSGPEGDRPRRRWRGDGAASAPASN